jgi:hypothetical protein
VPRRPRLPHEGRARGRRRAVRLRPDARRGPDRGPAAALGAPGRPGCRARARPRAPRGAEDDRQRLPRRPPAARPAGAPRPARARLDPRPGARRRHAGPAGRRAGREPDQDPQLQAGALLPRPVSEAPRSSPPRRRCAPSGSAGTHRCRRPSGTARPLGRWSRRPSRADRSPSGSARTGSSVGSSRPAARSGPSMPPTPRRRARAALPRSSPGSSAPRRPCGTPCRTWPRPSPA